MTQKKTKAKYILWGLGAALTVTAISIGYYFFGGKKTETAEAFEPEEPKAPASSKVNNQTATKPLKPVYSAGFPLRKGSRGTNVRRLQEALIKKYGKSILPEWGVDGDWGKEVQDALISKGLPTVITKSDLSKIISSSVSTNKSKPKTSIFDPLKIANAFHSAIDKHDFTKVRRLLSYIHTKNGYKSVNKYFKSQRTNNGNGVRKTLVTALLTKFKSSWGKKILTKHFYRIGLLFDGNQWSLNGVGLFDQIKVVRSAKVWDNKGQSLVVPAHTILGRFERAKNGVTQFRTIDGKTLYTNTHKISYV